jgi:hypothetical protein
MSANLFSWWCCSRHFRPWWWRICYHIWGWKWCTHDLSWFVEENCQPLPYIETANPACIKMHLLHVTCQLVWYSLHTHYWIPAAYRSVYGLKQLLLKMQYNVTWWFYYGLGILLHWYSWIMTWYAWPGCGVSFNLYTPSLSFFTYRWDLLISKSLLWLLFCEKCSLICSHHQLTL